MVNSSREIYDFGILTVIHNLGGFRYLVMIGFSSDRQLESCITSAMIGNLMAIDNLRVKSSVISNIW